MNIELPNDLNITELDLSLSPKQVSSLKNDYNRIQNQLDGQLGGKKDRHREGESDDSSSSSDEELMNAIRLLKYKQQQPIVYWWYNPLVYRTNDLYIPTFVMPLSPYVHINLNSAFMG